MSIETEQPKNYVELTNDMVLKIAKDELNKLKKSFESIIKNPTNKKTLKETNRLNEINKLIQKSELDQLDKENFVNALNTLKESINNKKINTSELQKKFDKITDLLDSMIQNELENLKQEIGESQTYHYNKRYLWQPNRPKDVEKEIEKSSEKIPQLIEEAKNDKSWFIRNVVAKLLERANS